MSSLYLYWHRVKIMKLFIKFSPYISFIHFYFQNQNFHWFLPEKVRVVQKQVLPSCFKSRGPLGFTFRHNCWNTKSYEEEMRRSEFNFYIMFLPTESWVFEKSNYHLLRPAMYPFKMNQIRLYLYFTGIFKTVLRRINRHM